MDGRLRFASNPPLVVPARDLDQPARVTEELQTWMTGLLDEYSRTLSRDRHHLIEQYTFVDIARKVVGVGSVGTRTWIILLRGA